MSPAPQKYPNSLEIQGTYGGLDFPSSFTIGYSSKVKKPGEVFLVALELPLTVRVDGMAEEESVSRNLAVTTLTPVICLSAKMKPLPWGDSTYHSIKPLSGAKLTWHSSFKAPAYSSFRKKLPLAIDLLKKAFTKPGFKLSIDGTILSTSRRNGKEASSNHV